MTSNDQGANNPKMQNGGNRVARPFTWFHVNLCENITWMKNIIAYKPFVNAFHYHKSDKL